MNIKGAGPSARCAGCSEAEAKQTKEPEDATLSATLGDYYGLWNCGPLIIPGDFYFFDSLKRPVGRLILC